MQTTIGWRAVVLCGALMTSACASSGAIVGDRPPIGKGAGGTDFGYWNRDAEGSIDQAFRSHITSTYKITDIAKAQATLEADGFSCLDGNRPDGAPVPDLECTRQFKLNDDVHAWSVRFWPDEARPQARYTRTHIRDPFKSYDDSPGRN